MTVAAALVPCFEGALGDSDELVMSGHMGHHQSNVL